MLAASRHLLERISNNPSCIVLEGANTAGGSALLWRIARECCQDGAICGVLGCLAVHTPSTARECLNTCDSVPCHWIMHRAIEGHQAIQTAVQHLLDNASKTSLPSNKPCESHGFLFVVDDASLLAVSEGPLAASMMLNAIRNHRDVRCMVVLAHPQVHLDSELELLKVGFSCTVRICAADKLQAEVFASNTGRHAELEVETSELRHSGRIRVDTVLLELLANGSIDVHRPHEALQITAQKLVATRIAGTTRDNLLLNESKRRGGMSSMKLSLSAQEQERREAVVLPWKHQGERAEYAQDDFRAYLPPAAGGHASSGQDGWGHIQYVRDSDGSFDSDEDPDDDLDI